MQNRKPDEVIAALDLKAGETLADIGAGSGYFTFRFARKVGDSGRVYAVDINSDMILYMNRYIRDKKVKNVTTVLSAPDDPLLPDVSINRFFICNTWHHVENRPQYIALMKKMLKPGGQIIVLDYKKEQLPVGPPPEMKMAREEVIREMEAGGFKLAKEHTFLPYQYFLVFAATLRALEEWNSPGSAGEDAGAPTVTRDAMIPLIQKIPAIAQPHAKLPRGAGQWSMGAFVGLNELQVLAEDVVDSDIQIQSRRGKIAPAEIQIGKIDRIEFLRGAARRTESYTHSDG